MLSGAEHLAFCKKHALQVLSVNLIGDAWATFVADLDSHPETKMTLPKLMSSMMLVEAEGLTKEHFKEFIERYDPKAIGLA